MPLLRDSDFQCRSVRVQRDAWETERRVRKLGRVLCRDHCVPGMRQGGWCGNVVARLPVLCDKQHDPKQLVEERVYFIHQVLVHHCGKSEQEVQQGRSFKKNRWRNAVYRLVPRTT